MGADGISLFILKSQPSSGDDFKPVSETPPRKQRGLFSDEEDSEVSISLRNPYRNPWDFSHPDFSPLESGDSLCLFVGLGNLTSMYISLAVLKVPLVPGVKALWLFSLFQGVKH